MNETKHEMLSKLTIPPEQKTRGEGGPVWIVILVVVAILAAGYWAYKSRPKPEPVAAGTAATSLTNTSVAAAAATDAVLTVSGYVIPRERIEISPRFMGTVKTISVKKGDTIKKGDVLVILEDEEYRARVQEAQGRVKVTEANLASAEVNLHRQTELAQINADSARALDDARFARDAAAAELVSAKGQLTLAETYLSWCTITAPIDGVVLEKLVNPNELVAPQSFGGGRGPSTAFLAMADLNDLQVEIDLNEADTPKVALGQPCRVSPEAYPDRKYDAVVAEIAPEANRSKGTLQIKVQVTKPDRFLTPELSARVDFLAKKP